MFIANLLLPEHRHRGIPFEWEMQPGTPKDPPKEEALPPLSPPPAVLSLGLPKPCIIHNIQDQPSNPNRRRRLVVLSEFMASPARDSSSSSSSSSLSRQSSRLQSPGWYPPMMNSSSSRANLSCSPWSIRSFLVTLAKRV
ncbi:hypothetical protein F8388_008369 [Cannabis sativa]|uniref:Uncharacterized protein n=1 Tax=Cannabis sativa TaxID=3483 RepID=A0A7J6E3I3_CANSA|nr:hypothetical protein F8388_008369 [Cannabis sativa]